MIRPARALGLCGGLLEKFDDLGSAILFCHAQRCAAISAFLVHGCSSSKQNAYDVRVTLPDGVHQRRPTHRVLRIYVGPASDKNLHYLHVPVDSRVKESRRVVVTLPIDVHAAV